MLNRGLAILVLVAVAVLPTTLTLSDDQEGERLNTLSGPASIVCADLVERGIDPHNVLHTVHVIDTIEVSGAPSAAIDYSHVVGARDLGPLFGNTMEHYLHFRVSGTTLPPATEPPGQQLLGGPNGDRNSYEPLVGTTVRGLIQYEDSSGSWADLSINSQTGNFSKYRIARADTNSGNRNGEWVVFEDRAGTPATGGVSYEIETYWRHDPDYNGPNDARMSRIWRNTPECTSGLSAP